MNFVGKFEASLPTAESGGAFEVVARHGPTGAITIPDADLLFNGDFKRSGLDLILSKNGHDLVVHDYFKGTTRAALASPDGAQLSGAIVNALTGHVEYAQAGGGIAAAAVIGHVTKLSGSATAIRNGVAVELHVGDNVNKGDVVQAGADSTLGLVFIDGTVFGLSSNARMVLNEMVYDPNGSSNSSLLSLVQGTITFVAGETAKHGDMKVNTPVATMGIRGTAVLVEIDFQVPGQGNAPPVKFQVLLEPGGHVGSYNLYSLTDPNVVIGTVNQAGQVTQVDGVGGISQSPAPPLSPAAQAIIGPALEQFFNPPPNPNPRSTGPNGSTPANPVPGSSNPDPLKLHEQDQPQLGVPTTIPIKFEQPGDLPGTPPTLIPVTFTVLKTISVTPVVNQTNVTIADQVTIQDNNPSDTLVPYVPGTAKIISAVGPLDGPSQTDLIKLLTLDEQTGMVSYDPAKFAFLTESQKVVITIGFESSAGSQTFQETLTETINGVKHVPVITAAAFTAVEGGTVVLKPSDIVVTDPDTTHFVFTVSSVTHGSFQTLTNGVWSNATSFTTDQIDAGLVRFQHDGSTVAPTFSIQADDGGATNHLSSVTAGNAGLDQPPPVILPPEVADPGPIHAPAGTPDGHGGYEPVVLSNNFGFTDADFFDSHIVTATFDAGASNLGPLSAPIGNFALDLLQDSTGGSQGLVNWSLTLSSTDLQNIDNASFLPAGSTVHEVFDVTIHDSHGGTAERQVSIEIDGPAAPANHVAPVVDPGSGPVVSYKLGGAGVAVDSSLTVSDADSAVLQSATVAITNFQSGDTLVFADTSAITGSFDPSTGILTLTGTDSVANYQAALESISYQNLDVHGSTAERTFSFQVDDGAASNHVSNVGTASVSVTADVPPVLDSFILDVTRGGTTVLSSSDYTITDPDSSNFFFSIQGASGGEFQVLTDGQWVAAPTGGFTTAQIAGGEVRFVQDGSASPPSFTISANDFVAAGPAITPTVNFTILDHWINSNGGDWYGENMSGDWSAGQLPGTASDVAIDVAPQPSPYVVTVSHDTTVRTLTISAGATLDIQAGGFVTTQGTGSGANAGTIQVDGGAAWHVGGTIDNIGAVEVFGSLLVDDQDSGLVSLTGGGAVLLHGGAIAGNGSSREELENVDNTISGTGTVGSGDGLLTLINDPTGIIDATGHLTLHTGDMIINAGLLEATAAVDSERGGTLDVRDRAIDNIGAGPNLGIVIEAHSTLLVDTRALHLIGGGTVSLEGGQIVGPGACADPVLDNVNNTISGAGAIGTGDGQLTLHNDRGGTIDATGGTLTLDTGNEIVNRGLLEATGGGTLEVRDGKIDNIGAGIGHGIVIDATSTLLVHSSHLRLTGGGSVSLDGGSIVAADAGSDDHVLENVNNTISGTGFIGSDDGQLTLHNDRGGIIDATGILVLDTGNKITNHGLLEATDGGTLDVQDSKIDNTGTGFSHGIAIDATSTLLVDTGHLRLTGDGDLALEGGSIVAANTGSGDHVLENVNNTISGTGFIGTGDGDLTLRNDQGGIIDATGVLVLDTGNKITNHGLLEATDGGRLDVRDGKIDNTGGGPHQGIVIGATSTLLVDTGTLLLTGGGAVTLNGGAIVAPRDGPTAVLDNVNDTITGAGSIGAGDGHLALHNERGGIIDATSGTLTVDTGDTLINTGLLAATTGGTLVVDDAITGNGSAAIGDGGILQFNSGVGSGQTVTFVGAGSLDLAQPASFHGEIAGVMGSDILDLAGFDASTTRITASFDSDTDITTLTVKDQSHHTVHLRLVGDYSAANFTRSSDGDGGTSIVVNQETPTVVTGQLSAGTSPVTFAPTTSDVVRLEDATISGSGGNGLDIRGSDATSSDQIVAELDSGSSISVTGEGSDGIHFTSQHEATSAAIAIFNAAAISASGSGGVGIFAKGDGSILVDDASNTTVSGERHGIEAVETNHGIADVDIDVGSNAAINSASGDGILAINKGYGNISVGTAASDVITAASSGIEAVNEAAAASCSSIVVNASGTINSGANATDTGDSPAGILAGYLGDPCDQEITPVPGLYGDVVVNNSAYINATAGDGIRAFNHGTGDVTVNDNAGTIEALGGLSPTDGHGDGILASNSGPGSINVFTAADAIIHAGGSGIVANNNASASSSDSEVSVLAYGTIASGTIPSSDGSPAAGILAGYDSADVAEHDVHGNVIIDDYALITAAAGTDGIRGYNFGTGSVTIIAEAEAVITAGRYGLAARGHDGGDVSVTNYGTVTADTAIDATTTTGNIAIDNHGLITGNIVVGDSTFVGHATAVNEFGGYWQLDGGSTFAGTSELTNDGFIYANGTSSITTSGALTFDNAEVVNVQSGSLDVGAAVTGGGLFNIAAGAELEFGASVAAGQMVMFQGSTGTLKIDDAAAIHSTIAGLGDDSSGTYDGADHIDLANVDFSSLTSTFDLTDDVLTVSDGSHTARLQLSGAYTAGSFKYQNDGNGGTMIWDPPVASPDPNASPVPTASHTIAADAPNALLKGDASPDTFVFNFTDVGQATVANFHADSDLLQIKSSIFANAQAILNATRDDGHGNTVIALDAHDSITLAGVTKGQLHSSDFHLV